MINFYSERLPRLFGNFLTTRVDTNFQEITSGLQDETPYVDILRHEGVRLPSLSQYMHGAGSMDLADFLSTMCESPVSFYTVYDGGSPRLEVRKH